VQGGKAVALLLQNGQGGQRILSPLLQEHLRGQDRTTPKEIGVRRQLTKKGGGGVRGGEREGQLKIFSKTWAISLEDTGGNEKSRSKNAPPGTTPSNPNLLTSKRKKKKSNSSHINAIPQGGRTRKRKKEGRDQKDWDFFCPKEVRGRRAAGKTRLEPSYRRS